MDTRNFKFRQGFERKVWEVESFGFRKSLRNFLWVVVHASRGRVFSYSSYFMLKGHSMAIGFNPNSRAGSKAVWSVLLTIERPISWSVLFLRTVTPQIPRVNFFFLFVGYLSSLSRQIPCTAYRAYGCARWGPVVLPVACALRCHVCNTVALACTRTRAQACHAHWPGLWVATPP